ncbi:MAG TPA: hypothetical protein PLK02_05570 [Paludibacteraceae bacterium]|nr:hypothetical protein [Paludibacteraceae bacterium]
MNFLNFNCQPSTINCQPSTINCQFSTINSIKTRSDKSDLKQHSFLTAHFTAFFGYINEVAYLVESGQLKILLEKRSTSNIQH